MSTTTFPAILRPAHAALQGLERISPIAFAVGICAALALGTLVCVLAATGGHFVYSLDDTYIHLALAERLAQGHYGINLGEVTSPSSSVIWPFLMLPLAGTALHAYLPLAVALACGLATAALYGRFAAELPMGADDPFAHLKRLAIAALLVLVGNTIGLAFTGLEHNLQVLLAAAAALGLIEAWRGRPVPTWAIVAAAIAPAVRYEMLAITAAMAIVLAGEKRWRDAVSLCAASIILPGLLGLFLLANGNLPLPNSVISKLHATQSDGGVLGAVLSLLRYSTREMGPKAMLWAILGILMIAARQSLGARRWVMAAAALAALLHFVVGRFGWFHRYEVYALVFCSMVALRAVADLWPRYLAYAIALLAIGSTFYLGAIYRTPNAARNIYDQQYQMGRFVQEHYRKPFAVNDLGLVSFNLDKRIYVLDLWGLASNEAVRQTDKSAAWLDAITRRHDAGLAIIYDAWFDERPASWTRVGRLWLSSRKVTPASDNVSFYATGAGDADEIRRHLEAFGATLPAGVRLEIAPR